MDASVDLTEHRVFADKRRPTNANEFTIDVRFPTTNIGRRIMSIKPTRFPWSDINEAMYNAHKMTNDDYINNPFLRELKNDWYAHYLDQDTCERCGVHQDHVPPWRWSYNLCGYCQDDMNASLPDRSSMVSDLNTKAPQTEISFSMTPSMHQYLSIGDYTEALREDIMKRLDDFDIEVEADEAPDGTVRFTSENGTTDFMRGDL